MRYFVLHTSTSTPGDFYFERSFDTEKEVLAHLAEHGTSNRIVALEQEVTLRIGKPVTYNVDMRSGMTGVRAA